MGLQDQLTQMREAATQRVPAEKLAVMHAATDALRDSGILDQVIKVGDRLPPFTLKNAEGVDVSSETLLARGAVVLTVFRGHW